MITLLRLLNALKIITSQLPNLVCIFDIQIYAFLFLGYPLVLESLSHRVYVWKALADITYQFSEKVAWMFIFLSKGKGGCYSGRPLPPSSPLLFYFPDGLTCSTKVLPNAQHIQL